MGYDATWTAGFPEERGYYWFYGHRDRDQQEKGLSEPELIFVTKRKFHQADGQFFWEKEAGDGVWTPVLIPNLPGDDS